MSVEELRQQAVQSDERIIAHIHRFLETHPLDMEENKTVALELMTLAATLEKRVSAAYTEKYRYCNHFHELTDDHQLVNFGDGEYVANKKAIPLLSALSGLGLRTRTHHVEDAGGFVSIVLDPNVQFEIRQINEGHSGRTKYNGMTEVLIRWQRK